MRQDPLAFPSGWNQSADFAKPLFGLYREAGLAYPHGSGRLALISMLEIAV